MSWMSWAVDAAERGWIPDRLTRRAIRRLCRRRIQRHDPRAQREFTASLRRGPIAVQTDAANRQHYELPPAFFAAVLGPRLKYSCCYFTDATTGLAAAEEEALEITCRRAQLADGQRILELGCGWGSLSLYMAARFPRSQITAVSNSSSQRAFIQNRAEEAGLSNLRVVTADINNFEPDESQFDRVVSVEMFEHMRNLELLLERISRWIHPAGKLFVHVFCHRSLTYPFAVDGDADWMARHFFTGGMMPSYDLLTTFGHRLHVTEHHAWSGTHYQRTAEAWLANLDANRADVVPALAETYGREQAGRWFHRWRIFLMAVAELFATNGGEEWFVGHYLFEPAEILALTTEE